jgi:hypothetical protein
MIRAKGGPPFIFGGHSGTIIIVWEEEDLPKEGPDGHYSMEDFEPLLKSGKASELNRKAIHDIFEVVQRLAFRDS